MKIFENMLSKSKELADSFREKKGNLTLPMEVGAPTITTAAWISRDPDMSGK